MTWSITMADMRRDGFEEGLTTGLEQGREQGAYETKLETAKKFLAMGLSPEQVAQGTSLPLDVVQGLTKNQ
ncbi:MAG: hypothetical protein J6R67_11175 [Treponema sp.]|nr:hypothetical protein [Treponema sp.]